MTMPPPLAHQHRERIRDPWCQSSDDSGGSLYGLMPEIILGKTTSAYARSPKCMSRVQRRLRRGVKFSYTVRPSQSTRQVEARSAFVAIATSLTPE